MPRNTLKDLTERYNAKLTEVRGLKDTFDNAAEGEARTKAGEAFESGLDELDSLKRELARAKKFEEHQSAFGDEGEGRSGQQPGEMTPGEMRSDKVDPVEHPDAKGYRLARVIDAMAQGRSVIDGVEAEVAQELEKRHERSANGILIPMSLRCNPLSGQQSAAFARMAGLNPRETRELNVTAGSAAIPTVLGTTLIDLLRNQAVATRAGITTLAGLEGTFEMPKVDGAPTFAWGGEGFNPSASNGEIGSKVTFTPKTVAARSKITRRFMKVAMKSLDAENWQRQQLLVYLALAIDYAVFHGSGSSNQPLGLFNNADVGVIGNGTDGGALTFGKLVDMETQVADANAEIGESCYVTNARVRGQAKQTLKSAVAGSSYIWENDQMNGADALMSNQISKSFTKGSGTNLSGVAYGVFSQCVLGLWSGADLLVDPYTSGGEGASNIYLHQDADIQYLHDEAFSVMKDVDAQLS